MKVYSGFGYFNNIAKTASVEISLPAAVNLPADSYKYQCLNISNTNYNALLIFIKKTSDSGSVLSAASLNYENVQVNLDTTPLFSDAGLVASAYNYNNNFILITCHEANTSVYHLIAKQFFQNLNVIASTAVISLSAPAAATGPTKTGVGGLKKM